MKTYKKLFLALVAITVLWIGSCVGATVKELPYEQQIGSHLDSAAHQQTPTGALQQLDIAVANMERMHLTTGSTGVFYTTENDKIDVWYRNLKSAQIDLRAVEFSDNGMLRTSVLTRFRDTVEHHPGDIGLYPHIFFYNFWWILGLVGFLVFAVWFMVEIMDPYPRY
jgi:hypothetical protein